MCRYHNSGFFYAADPGAFRRRLGVHTSGGVATEPPAALAAAVSVRCGRAPAENRPGFQDAASTLGERQALKLMGYTSHVGGMRPRWGGPLQRSPAPGRIGASGAPLTLRPSRLRVASEGGPASRALPCSRAPTKSPAEGHQLAHPGFTEKGRFFPEMAKKTRFSHLKLEKRQKTVA